MPDNPFEPMIKNIGNYVSGTLYAQGVIPPIGIDNYEGLALASQADTHLLAAKDPVIDEIAVGMTGNLISGKTVSGVPPLSLPNSAGYPLQYWAVNLSPTQDLHGYDAPWPAGGGANIIPLTVDAIKAANGGANTWNGNSKTIYGVTFTILTDEAENVTGINANGTATSSAKLNLGTIHAVSGTTYGIKKFNADDGGSFFGNINPRFSSATDANIYNDTTMIADSDKNVAVSYYIMTGGVANNLLITPFIAITSTVPTAFSPYSNLCPILGTDKLNMFVEESYDPSATPKAVITLPLTIYNGGVGNDGGWSSSVEVDMGDLDWIYHSEHDVFYYVTSDGKPSGTGQSGYGMCEAYNVMPGTYYTALTNGQMAVGTNFYSATTASIVVKDTRFTDAAQFKAAVAGVKLVYDIAIFNEFSIVASPVPTPTGNAETWAVAENGTVDSMEVGYIEAT